MGIIFDVRVTYTKYSFSYRIGYNGRDCVLRALCETTEFFGRKGSTMMKEILRLVFSLPTSKVLSFEHPELHMYDKAYRNGKTRALCSNIYPKCGFSLFEVALNGYFEPITKFKV